MSGAPETETNFPLPALPSLISNVISAPRRRADSSTEAEEEPLRSGSVATGVEWLQEHSPLSHVNILPSGRYRWYLEQDWNLNILHSEDFPPRVLFVPLFTASDFESIDLPPSASETVAATISTSKSDPSYSVDECTAAARALFSRNARPNDIELQEFRDEFSLFIDRFRSAGVNALFSEIVELGSKEERTWIAIDVLGEHPNRPTLGARKKLLLQLLNAVDDPGLRYCAAEALGNLGGSDVVTALNKRLEREQNQSVQSMIHAQLREYLTST